MDKLEWCGYSSVKNFWRYVYSLWQNTRTWQTNRRTDTARRHKQRLCVYASRGKTCMRTGVGQTLEALMTLRRRRNPDKVNGGTSSWPAWWSKFLAALSCSRPTTTIARHQAGACDIIKPTGCRKSNEWSYCCQRLSKVLPVSSSNASYFYASAGCCCCCCCCCIRQQRPLNHCVYWLLR